jgi:uncharacterized membrane protein (UPF0182 family)
MTRSPESPRRQRTELPPPIARLRRLVLFGVAAFFLVVIVMPWLATFATDWLWFGEIGFRPVFMTSLVWRALLFGLGGLVAFAMLYGNGRLALRQSSAIPSLFLGRLDAAGAEVVRIVPRILLGASLFIAFVIATTSSALWMTFARAMRGVSVGTADPLFGRDIGWYLFQLPAVSAVLNVLIALTMISLVTAALIYVLHGDLVLPPRRATVTGGAALHLGVLVVAVFVLIAIRLWRVRTAGLLFSTTGPLLGASYTDVNVMLPALRVSAAAALVAAGLALYGVIRGKLVWYTVIGAVGYAVVSVLGRGVLPAAVQRLVVAPNELTRERPYLERHIAATQRAWGLDSVSTRDLSGTARLTLADIRANGATMDNVRLWERDLLQQTFGQLQEIRTYYDFVRVHDDRYQIDGRYRQVHLAARELNAGSLPTRTFINEHLTFTHGMGITMAPVNQVTTEGLPVLFIKDLPPASSISLKLTRPQVYYGQLTHSYVFAGTRQREFDYPAGEQDIYATYTGRGGVPLRSLLRRALYAWQLGSLNVLLSRDITNESRILYRRHIDQRARTALPFLQFDDEPYLVVNDAGELKWMLDAYTASAWWPYSQRTSDGRSYMRNSVKVVIDAYDGTVDAYIADPADPLIRAYDAVFRGIFKPITDMPADLRRHVRYPGDLFRLQTALHATYHMIQPETFYHREDQWQIPGGQDAARAENPFMRHIILRLPGEQNPEFIYMTPFTPQGKDNLAAWMVARMDGDHYGKLVVYRFPKQSLVYGPRQIVNRINQDTEISRQISLWDRSGTQVIRGELLVIPIEESLIYVMPLYLRAEGGTIPELKRVIVAHENQVVMAETLEQGVSAIFGGPSTAPRSADVMRDSLAAAVPAGAPIPAAIADLARQAEEIYNRAVAAQRAGDWAAYGREITALGEVIRRMRRP